MRRTVPIISIFVALLSLSIFFVEFSQASPQSVTISQTQLSVQDNITLVYSDSLPTSGAGIPASRHDNALFNTEALMVFGPEICSAWGDPFSPITPTWSAIPGLNPEDYQGPYTYRFRLRIPADYPDNIVRVELLDPDSINQAENVAEVVHSQTAQLTDPAQFPNYPVEMTCSINNQKNVCYIDTGEANLVGSNGITYDHINALWFMRVDENRGIGTDACASFPGYSPQTNTQTLFQLSYYTHPENGTSNQVVLGSYTGQVGDSVRDNGDHDTDLRWVSPGAAQSFDQPTFVPAEAGSFEVDLTQDVSNIQVDPLTGEKVLYLDVTSLSGGSKNGFAIWAGPDDYANSIPSHVNDRNLYILNNPGSHAGKGIKVEAVENLPRQSSVSDHINFPVVDLGPEYAGQTITVTMFDLDVGTRPPVRFFMDTLAFSPDDSAEDGINHALTDWAVSYGGSVDPLGRCFSGGASYTAECNNAWINPVYTITLPSEQNCDSPETCMPFYGGQLQTRFRGGMADAHVWHVDLPERPLLDNTQSCTAFPIAVDDNIRSVLPPDDPNGDAPNRWRTDFDYPNPGPNYYSFYNHQPNTPLLEAQEGYIYNIKNGDSADGQGWLAWNQCMVADTNALVNSLTWPGNSNDYSILPGTCTLNGETLPRFAGFMEFGDNDDRSMHIGDWVSANSGSVNSSSLIDTLEGHIDLGRILRVIVYDNLTGSGGNMGYRISRLALMRVIGFSLDSSGDPFIMAEFIGWDDSCGQAPISLESVTLNGPDNGLVDTSYTYTATVAPITTSLPITIVWTATDTSPMTQTNQIESTQAFQWSSSGIKTITVTVNQRNFNFFTNTVTTTIVAPSIPLTDVVIQPQPEIVGNVVTLTAVATPTNATRPITYTWQTGSQIISHTTGLTDIASFSLPYSSTQTITVTASNGIGQPVSDTIEVTIEPLEVFLPLITQPQASTNRAINLPMIKPTAQLHHIDTRNAAISVKNNIL